MIKTDINMAVASFKATKLRSFLTILGIVIGVSSVVLIISLGQGIKKEIIQKIQSSDETNITITPGKIFNQSAEGNINGFNIASYLGTSSLSDKDVSEIKKLANITAAAPIGVLTGTVETESDKKNNNHLIMTTTADFTKVINKKVRFGNFFSKEDEGRNVALIGIKTATTLFNEESPIGRRIIIRGQDFIVKGVLDDFKQSFIDFNFDYNNSVIIPIESAKKIQDNNIAIREIQVKVTDANLVKETSQAITETLKKNRSGTEDFSLYRNEDYLKIANQLINIITGFMAAIAGISIFVGGVGVMNIMFVSVTERTKEIGIRKALGATNRQIMGQFIVEAIILTLIGGILGVLIALSIGWAISMWTRLTPSYDYRIVGAAILSSVIVGVIFGLAPAVKAASRNPIESLRHHS